MKTDEKSLAIAKPRRPWMRWLKRLGKVLLLALIAIVIRQAWHHYEVTKKLQETLAELDRTDPGWRLEDVEAARAKIPEKENSARVVVAAAQLLPKNWPPKESSELYTHLAPEEQLASEDFKRLKQELDNVRPALDKARKLEKMPRGRHHLEYKPFVMDTLLNDQQATRRVVDLLLYDALRLDQQRDMIRSLNSLKAAVHAARSVGDEPFAISQLIRMAGIMQSCQGIEHALAQGEPPTEKLAELQDLLRSEDDFPELFITARGERASLHETFAVIERGEVPLTHSFFGPRPSWEEYVYGWHTRGRFRDAHPTMLAVMSRFVTIAQLPMHKQLPAERNLDRELHQLKESNPLAVLFIPALPKVSDAGRRKHAYLRSMMVALAAECYHRSQSTWPETIDTLCPKYLSAVPLDPFDGQQLRYCRLEDGVVIYSVGHDVVDDNGNLDREHPMQPGVDIGFRLWDVAKRRQPPRPK